MSSKTSFQGILLTLLLASLACGRSVAPFPDPTYTPRAPRLGSGQTAYGFFPTPSLGFLPRPVTGTLSG